MKVQGKIMQMAESSNPAVNLDLISYLKCDDIQIG